MRFDFSEPGGFHEILIENIIMSCDIQIGSVQEMDKTYKIAKGKKLDLILTSPLSSNINQRGDSFVTQLKDPLKYKETAILPANTKFRRLVKSVKKYEKLGIRRVWFC
ncbi:hypothetical protein BVX98_07310 [bacterium F11]|nr:hypothetical protein BVX98_07310 [bacterium F11]